MSSGQEYHGSVFRQPSEKGSRENMGNVWRVFKRDVLRLLKVPPALVVVVALLVLPSVYTWYNVVGFWDPYANTGNLRVCVVNEDAGASSELTGEVRAGDMIVAELRENHQLDWVFADREAAMEPLQSGESYAVFVIPADFSEHLLSLTTGDFVQPEITYYVNEKAGPVAPKITDTGASTLDETINSAFVATVSDAVAKALDEAADGARDDAEAARSQAQRQVEEALQAVGGARSSVEGVADAADRAQGEVQNAKGALDAARAQLEVARDALADVSQLTAQLQAELAHFAQVAVPAVGEGVQGVSDASTKAHGAIADMTAAAGEARAGIDASIAQARSCVEEQQALAAYVRGLAEALPEGDPAKDALALLADDLDASAGEAQQALDGLSQLGEEAERLSQSIGQASDALDAAVQTAADATQAYADELFGTAVPALNQSLAQLSSAAASLGASVEGQELLVGQASLALDQLDATLKTAKEALGQTGGLLGDLEADLGDVRTDVTALGASDALAQLAGEGGLDAAKVADFMGSPTEVVTERLYAPNAYGAAMAPLFMNLTFWIGAFMLMVILRQEVDDEGVARLTITQRYLGRFALLAVLAVLQACICCAGVLAIGVETASAPALFFAAAVASLAYLSIVYALSTTLQHIGKGLCIVLVFAQIPGATGLYPIEMTSGFFQAVYPALPFTYGIRAMREAICGFYGSHYAVSLGVLALFFAAFMAIGLLVRPLMANVNRMVAAQVRQSGLFNGEDVEVPARPYRLSQLFFALAGKEAYRERLRMRYERFSRWYPRLMRGSVALGIAVPVALTVVFALTPAEKVWLLTAWLVWLVAVFVFLAVVESMRAGFERQAKLGAMTDEGLLELGMGRNAMERACGDGPDAEGDGPGAAGSEPDAAECAAGGGPAAVGSEPGAAEPGPAAAGGPDAAEPGPATGDGACAPSAPEEGGRRA